jgi:hypothetical protein
VTNRCVEATGRTGKKSTTCFLKSTPEPVGEKRRPAAAAAWRKVFPRSATVP